MPHYGQFIGIIDDIETRWLVELGDTGAPLPALEFIAAESMPDVEPVWSITIGVTAADDVADGIAFTREEAAEISLMMMRRRMAVRAGGDPGS